MASSLVLTTLSIRLECLASTVIMLISFDTTGTVVHYESRVPTECEETRRRIASRDTKPTDPKGTDSMSGMTLNYRQRRPLASHKLI